MNFFRLLKRRWPAFLACLALLIGQAWSDLALPGYMSEIVDVGIQQGGIASPLPETIRAQSLDDLELFMTAEDADMVEAAYAEPDGDGVRALRVDGDDERAALEDAIALPETIVLQLIEGVDAGELMGASSAPAAQAGEGAGGEDDGEADGGMAASFLGAVGRSSSDVSIAQLASLMKIQGMVDANDGKLDMEALRLLAETGVIGRDELARGAQSLMDSLGAMAGSIVKQRAVTYVAREYEGQGVDLAAVQSSYLWTTAAVMFGYCMVALVCAILVALIASRTAAAVGRDLRHDVFSKVMGFSSAEVNAFSQASLITRCTNDVQQIQMVSVMFMRMVMLAPVMGAVALIRVLGTDTGLEWTIAVALGLVLAGMGLLMGITLPKFKLMQKLIDGVNLKSRDMLDGLMPMRAFGRQRHELDEFADASLELMRTQLFTSRAMAMSMPLLMLVMNVFTLAIVWFGAHGVDQGVMQVGDMMAFISYAMQIIMSFMVLSMVFIMLPRASVASDRIVAVLDRPLTIVEPASPVSPEQGVRGVLVFDDVSFKYPDADVEAIEHVSFETAPGRTTAIIGPTGSGKTTAVQLVPRLFDATSGTVSLDGVDVRDMALADLRSRIGYVPQQGMLFAGSIASNVGFGLDDPDDAELMRACDIAQATEFVAEKEEGLDTPISQRGANVSGGQRQRLAIARALAIRPEVLVFDDSFSALDYATDARLRERLRSELDDTAVVVVAQRIATIMRADEIIVLDEGRVVGRGTHEELLRGCPIYLDIAKSQLSPKELGLEGGER